MANGQAGELYAIDPDTGAANVIDMGGEAVHGDGLVSAGVGFTSRVPGVTVDWFAQERPNRFRP